MTTVTWNVDINSLEKMCYGDLVKSIKDKGHKVNLVDYDLYKSISEQYDMVADFGDDYDTVYINYGSIQFCEELKKYGYGEGNIGLNGTTKCTSYMSFLPQDLFLNKNAIFITWGMFKQRKEFYKNNYREIFIRPNSGFKTFSGQPILTEDIDDHINTLDQISSVTNDTLIMVNESLNIGREFRFIIAGNKVVAGTGYNHKNKIKDNNWPEYCEDFANMVATEIIGNYYYIDEAYTMDICILNEQPKIVEFNSFSSAGIYHADVDKVVEAVSEISLKDYI